jgi:hypothetical protein
MSVCDDNKLRCVGEKKNATTKGFRQKQYDRGMKGKMFGVHFFKKKKAGAKMI